MMRSGIRRRGLPSYYAMTNRGKEPNVGVMGGKYQDLQRPIRRFWRWRDVPVHVVILKHYGVGVHWWVTVRQERNPIWGRGREHWTWIEPWDDPTAYRGGVHTKSFRDITKAENWAKRVCRKHFPGQPVKIENVNSGKHKWFYRDGD